GAVSALPIDGDGFVEFDFTVESGVRAVGLSAGGSDHTIAGIDYAFALAGDTVTIRERGVYRMSGPASKGDVFRISIEAGRVHYYKNGEYLYTSTAPAPVGLRVDSALLGTDTTLQRVRLSR